MLDFPARTKKRKVYELIPERWNLAEKISKEEFKLSEAQFMKIVDEDDLQVKLQILENSREYLQVKFRTLEVGDHVFSFKEFWSLPHGLTLLSSWFQWVTGGSDDGWLCATIEKNLESVLIIISEIISDKKGNLWYQKMKQYQHESELRTGNQTSYWVYLLREWSKMYKENPSRFIFIEGEDSIQDISTQPHVNVRTVANPGQDFAERVVVSVKVGGDLVFEDIGLSAALAAAVEIAFVFNLCYDKEADSTVNFVQRILGGFGPDEGARNEKGMVKGSYISFQSELGSLLVRKKLGAVKSIFK